MECRGLLIRDESFMAQRGRGTRRREGCLDDTLAQPIQPQGQDAGRTTRTRLAANSQSSRGTSRSTTPGLRVVTGVGLRSLESDPKRKAGDCRLARTSSSGGMNDT